MILYSIKTKQIKKKIKKVKENYRSTNYEITILNKMRIIIIIFSSIYLSNYISLEFKSEIIIDNRLKFVKEDNMNFSKYKSMIKPIALYNPIMNLIDRFKINFGNENIDDNIYIKILEEDINLARSHGIIGFGFKYIFPSDNNIYVKTLDIINENKNLNIRYLLIILHEKKKTNIIY
jgi:hypothetical protein